MLGMDLFRVYTRLTCTGLASGGAVRARSIASSHHCCCVSVQATGEMGLVVRPTLHRDAGTPPVPRSVALSCAR